MKKIYFALITILFSISVFAGTTGDYCSQQQTGIARNNCWNSSIRIQNNIIRNTYMELMALPNYPAERKEFIQQNQVEWENNVNTQCTTNQCFSNALISRSISLLGELKQYKNKQTAAVPAAAVSAVNKSADKWIDQCVIAKGNAVIYTEQNGTVKKGIMPQTTAFSVSVANGNDLVGIKTVPDWNADNPEANANKFVGYVKKSELEMQDLRNCN